MTFGWRRSLIRRGRCPTRRLRPGQSPSTSRRRASWTARTLLTRRLLSSILGRVGCGSGGRQRFERRALGWPDSATSAASQPAGSSQRGTVTGRRSSIGQNGPLGSYRRSRTLVKVRPLGLSAVLVAEDLRAEHDGQREAVRVLSVRLGRTDHDPQVIPGDDQGVAVQPNAPSLLVIKVLVP